MPQIGEIRKARELGYKGKDRRIWARCELCGRERWTFIQDNTPKHPRCNHCALKDRTGTHNHNWKGGRHYSNGWVRVWQPSHPQTDNWGYVLEHRLIMEEILGRFLLPNETIHHLNGIKDDNRPDNLVCFDSLAHSRVIPVYRQRIRELEKLIDGEKDA